MGCALPEIATARSVEEAVAELERCAGSQFDPLVVAAFLRIPLLTRLAAVTAQDVA